MADHAIDLMPTLPQEPEPFPVLGLWFEDVPQPANDDHRYLPERLVPDLPPAVGFMLVGAFAWIIGAYLITFWSDLQALEMVVVDAVYASVYLGVPWLILKLEPRTGQNPTLAVFLDRGLQTFTGHLTGMQALVQILTIPVALASATTAMCLVARLA
ncbi:hypothetical protein [Salinarimonas soli]|uniref:Uncharacterized protein n=1 Tax=Salinarimonas soli TaxID=1638099 RepID=A0A5B2VCJ8_9HYPH|nr:hypothetical protein [Salinarimonas soli]KAA2236478.1 hypothetical protein F0L46_15165 [Salinarimonas soli]